MEQRLIDADAYAAELWKLRENYQMLDDTHTADKIMHGIFRAEQTLKEQPTIDAVPWEFLERYADWFCASVSFQQFIQEAKAFYSSSVAAMDGFIITDGERKDDGTTVD